MPAASATRAISPSSASTSRTRWPLPSPPIAGLQDIAPMVANRWVTSAVAAPMRAAALAASQPAWPPPMTMTSNDSCAGIMARTSTARTPTPEDVSRETSTRNSTQTRCVELWAPQMFHVKHPAGRRGFVNGRNERVLLTDTELAEDHVEDVLEIDPA